MAASDDAALRFERLQAELGDGPALVAYRTGSPVAVIDIRKEEQFSRFARRAVTAGLVSVFTFPLRSSDGTIGALDLYCDRHGGLDGEAMRSAQTLADVAAVYVLNSQARADLRDAAIRTHEVALHDPLTGLPNRVLLLERLEHAVLRGRWSGNPAAVFFADIDHFKQVNERHGHGVGDELLVAVGHRLEAALRPGDTLARTSGNEFVVLCEDLDGPAHVEAIGDRVVSALAVPFDLSVGPVEVSASVGVAFSGPGDKLSQRLLDDADAAMYQAKRRGGDRQQLLDLRAQVIADERRALEDDLGEAQDRGQLRADYQPIIRTTDGRIMGCEALLRWDHPTKGVVPPGVVVPLAEQSGLIVDLGRWILGQACIDRHRWPCEPGGPALTVAVNVSAHQLMAPDFTASVAAILAATDTDPALVTLEVTETAFIRDRERVLVVLDELKKLGVGLALDDFGTGYSSLTFLKQFPIDVVKIDQSFVADLDGDGASHAITRAVIELAHLLGMSTVAEGVETATQHHQLQVLGSDFCQGFHFARPASTEVVSGLLASPPVGHPASRPVPPPVSGR